MEGVIVINMQISVSNQMNSLPAFPIGRKEYRGLVVVGGFRRASDPVTGSRNRVGGLATEKPAVSLHSSAVPNVPLSRERKASGILTETSNVT
jgi:hypothetical protein